MTSLDPRRLLPPFQIHTLDGGLTLCLMENHTAPLVATALIYRVGTRHEKADEAGAAHFLEHMMFKGSEHFGAGEIDRLTQALGGSNNAYTSHDATLYYFTFAADRWQHALRIEADRMAGLRLDPDEVTSERQVIVEEIAMYEGDPWDALDQQVASALYGEHAYGRPVLGTRQSLASLDGEALRSFHRRHYRPDNAVLVLAGDVDPSAVDIVQAAFEGLSPGEATHREIESAPRGEHREGPRRIVRHQGDVARLLVSLPISAGTAASHPLLSVIVAVLGSGRASRLHRTLVDEEQLCTWVTAEMHETVEPGQIQIALEVLPGVDPRRVEERLLTEIVALSHEGPTADEVERARRVLLADWIFGHERVHQQAFFAATAIALFDAEHPWRYFERLQGASLDELKEVARRFLRPEHGVVGWSLPLEVKDPMADAVMGAAADASNGKAMETSA